MSTRDQVLNLQMDALTRAGCDPIYADHGESGAKASRPQFDACLAALRPGDTLVVYSLSRAGRSMVHLTSLLANLKARGVGFVSLTEGIDTTTAMGEMIYGILASIAQFERSVIMERCEAGRESARERGVRFGRPSKMAPEMVDYIRMARDQGSSVKEIVETTGYGTSTVYEILRKR